MTNAPCGHARPGADGCTLCAVARRSPRHARLWWGDPPLPGLLTRAANLAGSALRHAAAGCPQAAPEEQSRRVALCQTCDQYRSDGRCAQCGCPTATKAAWSLEKCPLGKW